MTVHCCWWIQWTLTTWTRQQITAKLSYHSNIRYMSVDRTNDQDFRLLTSQGLYDFQIPPFAGITPFYYPLVITKSCSCRIISRRRSPRSIPFIFRKCPRLHGGCNSQHLWSRQRKPYSIHPAEPEVYWLAICNNINTNDSVNGNDKINLQDIFKARQPRTVAIQVSYFRSSTPGGAVESSSILGRVTQIVRHVGKSSSCPPPVRIRGYCVCLSGCLGECSLNLSIQTTWTMHWLGVHRVLLELELAWFAYYNFISESVNTSRDWGKVPIKDILFSKNSLR